MFSCAHTLIAGLAAAVLDLPTALIFGGLLALALLVVSRLLILALRHRRYCRTAKRMTDEELRAQPWVAPEHADAVCDSRLAILKRSRRPRRRSFRFSEASPIVLRGLRSC